MANRKYTVITFSRRVPAGMGTTAQGEWFYYELGVNNEVTLTGYRAGTQDDVERYVEAIINRLNHDNPNTVVSTASRLIFPTATVHEDEEGNVGEDDDSPPPPEEVDE